MVGASCTRARARSRRGGRSWPSSQVASTCLHQPRARDHHRSARSRPSGARAPYPRQAPLRRRRTDLPEARAGPRARPRRPGRRAGPGDRGELVLLGRRRARPATPPGLAGHRTGRQGHRTRCAEDRQGGGRPPGPPGGARHRPVLPVGGQALPGRRAPDVPPRRRLPGGAPGPPVPGDAGDDRPDRVRPADDRRAVGGGRVRRAGPALGDRRRARPDRRAVPRAVAGHRADAGVPGRARGGEGRAPAGPVAARSGAVARPVGAVGRRAGRAGPRRLRARRPVAVQPAGAPGAAGADRPAPGGRRGGQPAGPGLPGPRRPGGQHLVRGARPGSHWR